MSELDLNAPLEPPAGARDAAAPEGLVLHPPAPVPEVGEEQAVGMVAVPADKRAELAARAEAFVADLASEPPQSPTFARKVDDIVRMGEQEIRASAQVSNRMLERPASSLAAAQRAQQPRGAASGGDAQTRVAEALSDLRATVTDLDPARADLTGPKKLFAKMPGGRRLTRYFERYASAQDQLDAIIVALARGQDELRRDNASLEAEKVNLWVTMGRLSEYATLASALDAATSAKIEELRASDPRAADALSADALFPIRQRRQDLTTQIAVSVQGYLALDMIRKNNVELVKGVDRARTTTVSALRTAVIVAQALASQRLVLDQIGALNETTNTMIERTSELLKAQTATIHEQASSSGVSVETLQQAFDDVFATMDAIDTFKAQAVESMASTVEALEGQVTRSQAYLERARRGERDEQEQLEG